MSKRLAVLALTVLLVSALGFSQARYGTRPAAAPAGGAFYQNAMILSPELAVTGGVVAFGSHFEYGFKPTLGLGGDLLFYLEGSGGLMLAPDVHYHFNLNTRDFDLFVGGGPAVVIGFSGGSAFAFKIDLGGRFYFQPRKLAGYAKVFASLSEDSSLGAAFGISFNLR